MYGKGPFGKALDVAAQVTGGVCPTCTYETMFVSLSPEIYRCMNCGTDTEQKVNGVISYIPMVVAGGKTPTLTQLNSDTKENG